MPSQTVRGAPLVTAFNREAAPALATVAVNPVQTAALIASLALLFFLMSSLHHAIRVRLYPLYLFGIPAFAGLLLSGGIQRALRERLVLYWVGFCICMAAAVPFSSWKGDSAALFYYYLRTVFSVLVLIAGLTVTWRHCKMVMYTTALSAAGFVFSALAFQQQDNIGRLSLEFGTLRNSNDLAAALILLLPSLLWVAFTSRSVLPRLVALAVAGVGFYEILHSGSRGAVLALSVGVLFYLWRATTRQRFALLLAMVPIGVLAIAALPRAVIRRATQFSSEPAGIRAGLDVGAIQSSQTRWRLLQKSIEYTFRFPIFGVGPGQFSNYEGAKNISPGSKHGMWHVTHNAYTQVSSECGIPAFLLFMTAIVASYRALSRVHRQARERPDCQDIRVTTFCVMLAMVMFCVAITFLSLAYTVYLPVLTALTVAIARVAPEEFRARVATAPVQAAKPGLAWPPRRKQAPGF